jgi:hypothetical protein
MSLTHAPCITSDCIVRPACRIPRVISRIPLDDFRMIGLAGVAETLGKIVWANAVQVDARHRGYGFQVVQRGDILQQTAHQKG